MASSQVDSLAQYLDGEYWQLKEQLRAYIDNNDLFKLRFDLPLDEYRKITLERAKSLFSTKEIKQQFELQAKNERNFINRSLALGEVVSTTDLSTAVKMGVMTWLFGGAVKSLGTEAHMAKWFHPLKNLEFTGMFAMSEKAHGSNVRGIETTAHFEKDTQEFIIHSPSPDASKMYIGNAMMGDCAAVFAQLYINGISKGPHCFIVPIRDGNGVLPGITVTDMGLKEGLHGVDNGIISFDHVRIPKENLLNKYADVGPDGSYTTSIQSDGFRFSTVIGALLGARVGLSLQALACMKIGLEIAIKYSMKRRQFGPSGAKEVVIMDYQTHQMRLMPKLATALGIMFAARRAGDMLDKAIYKDENIVENRRLQMLAAGLKAYSTWESVDTLQACREATGGMGYMEDNRIANLKRDADVFVTFEGDNVVMLQQVVKELLVEYGKRFNNSKMRAAVSGAVSSVIDNLRTSFLAVSFESATSLSFVKKAFIFKEEFLLRNLAFRLLNKVSSLNEEPFLAWADCLDHVCSLALCHVQRVTLEEFEEAVNRCPTESDRKLLQKFCELYSVHILYEDRAWHLEQKFISPSMSKELRDKYISLCSETKDDALRVIEAFRHPRNSVHAPIAGVPNPQAEWAYYPDTQTPKSKL